ncbi:hypothetical protein ABZ345_06620 [Lentzea sp. NPDC005914]|uniref:hypothetical protein n=1 Tax=Lentzea sp. NPDC005914 TaxID=3154572 RepID=UPI0033C5E505
MNGRLDVVGRDEVVFATMRPHGSSSATLERRVVVLGPPELRELAESGDISVAEGLIGLLEDPSRAWAAQVLLAAMTGREEKLVESFQGRPDWWDTVGKTAHARWRAWFDGARLSWDADERRFVEAPTRA